jgi:hypothetical protein
MARNIPVIKAGCYNLPIHSGANDLLFRTGKERHDSFFLNIARLSFPMDVMMKWSPANVVVARLREGERPCCISDWMCIKSFVRRA